MQEDCHVGLCVAVRNAKRVINATEELDGASAAMGGTSAAAFHLHRLAACITCTGLAGRFGAGEDEREVGEGGKEVEEFFKEGDIADFASGGADEVDGEGGAGLEVREGIVEGGEDGQGD